MSKKLYHLRITDQHLLSFDGNSWSDTGQTPGFSNWNSSYAHGITQYGNDLAMWGYDAGTGQNRLFTRSSGVWSGQNIASSTYNVGAPVNSRGALLFPLDNNGKFGGFAAFTGTFSVTVDPIAPSGGWAVFQDSNKTTYDQNGFRAIAHGTKVLAFSSRNPTEANSRFYARTAQTAVVADVSAAGIPGVPTFLRSGTAYDGINYDLQYPYTASPSGWSAGVTVAVAAEATRSSLCMFSFNGSVYSIGGDAILSRIQESGLTTVLDLTTAPVWNSRTVGPTSAGSTSGLSSFSALINGFPIWGAKITASGKPNGTVVTGRDDTSAEVCSVDSSNAVITYTPGSTLTIFDGLRGFRRYGLPASNHDHTTEGHITTFEYGGYVYIFIAGQYSPGDATSVLASRTYLIKWDGVSTTFGAWSTGLSAIEIKPSGVVPDCKVPAVWGDPSDGKIHVVTLTGASAMATHFYVDVTSGVVTDVGSVYAISASSNAYSINCNGSQNLFGMNTNDTFAKLTNIAKSSDGSQVTLTVVLSNADSHAVSLAIDYNVGSGWVPCVSFTSALTGLAVGTRTLVHNLSTDRGGQYTGPIQYRVRVLV